MDHPQSKCIADPHRSTRAIALSRAFVKYLRPVSRPLANSSSGADLLFPSEVTVPRAKEPLDDPDNPDPPPSSPDFSKATAPGVPFPAFFALSGPGLNQAFWLLVFIAGAISYYYLAKRKRILVDNPPDPWADPDVVDHVMVLAVDQASSVQIEARGGSLTPLAGLCVNLDDRILTVQLLHPLSPARADEWSGRDVTAYFYTVSGQKMHFYRFDSLILRYGGDDGCPMVEMARPSRLDPFQRRLFCRAAPPRSHVLAAGLWSALPVAEFSSIWLPEDSPLQDDSIRIPASRNTADLSGHVDARPEDWSRSVFPLPDHPADLPSPVLAFFPPHSESLHVANISASGVGIRVTKKKAAAIPEACVLFVSLLARDGKALNLWLACRKKHITSQPGRSSALVGLQLVEWSRVSRADSPLSWNKVNSRGEVKPLMNWIIRHEAALRRANAKFVNL